MVPMRCVAIALAVSAIAANAQTAPARFSLILNGRKIGTATYQFKQEKHGFRVTANYLFWIGSTDSDCMRIGDLGLDYNLKSDALAARVNGVLQQLKITANEKAKKFDYSFTQSREQANKSFDLHPRTVVLNNFDPSGVQELIDMAATQPASTQDYWALLAQGRGIEVPITLEPAAPAEGSLNGANLALKHWKVTIGEVEMDIWADQKNELMEAAVSSQSLAYIREGFALDLGALARLRASNSLKQTAS